ncbi:hypothetical protein EIP86_007647 [Pleurotus ostreatoroseus]|nr:hypothetical protein EIP86_007647 [Pleurotus ostreatoroseus]
MSLMNSLWSVFDWLFPSIRLSDDYDDPEAYPSGHISLRRRSFITPSRLRPQPQLDAPQGDWSRQREQYKDYERERERQRAVVLEQDNVTLRQRIAALEHDLSASNKALSTLQMLSAPPLSLNTILPSPPSPPLDPGELSNVFGALKVSQDLTHQALYERTEEVSSLRSFLSKTDDWSGAQLLQAMRDLNAEIVQLAASIADGYAAVLDRRVNLTRLSDREAIENALGRQIADLLARRDHAADPTLLQFAIQAWEIVCVNQILDAFCFGLPAEVDDILAAVFERMHQHEPQPTTARWRALTHSHLCAILPSHTPPTPISPGTPTSPSSPLDAYADNALRGLISILAVAGCSDSKILRRDTLRARLGTSFLLIGQRASEIARAIREGVMSAAFEVVVVPPSIGNTSGFDEETMDNMFAGISGADKGRVLCTVEFGLVCVRKAASAMPLSPVEAESPSVPALGGLKGRAIVGAIDTGSGYASATFTRSLLLKPKVLLDSVKEVL